MFYYYYFFRRKLCLIALFAEINSVNFVIFVFIDDFLEIIAVAVDYIFEDNGFFKFPFFFGKTFRIEDAIFFSVVLNGVNKLEFDIVAVFTRLQSESGEFDIRLLSSVNWLAVAIVTAACVVVSLALFFTVYFKNKKICR